MQSMKQYYRLSEVAKMLDVSYVTMWRWCNEGLVATMILPSGQRRVTSAEVLRLLQQSEPQAKQAQTYQTSDDEANNESIPGNRPSSTQ